MYAAEVRAGDYVAVAGIGGVGINAVQGARLAGAEIIAAIDPSEFKRQKAKEFGATHTYASIQEAQAGIADATWNRRYDKVVMTVGIASGELLAEGVALAGKRGRVVVTNTTPVSVTSVPISPLLITFFETQVQGTVYGSCNARSDIPRLLERYSRGQLEIAAQITRTNRLEQINEGYQDMRDGKNIRGVLIYP